jgi:hypothetical protein
LQLRKAAAPSTWGAGSETAPFVEGNEMRIVETAAAGLIALASQILVVAVVLL